MRLLLAASLIVSLQQPQTPVFRGGADIVVVNTQVSTGDGAPVEGLTLADFSLTVDGKPRPLAGAVFQQIDQQRNAQMKNAMSTLSMDPTLESQSFVMVVANPSMMRPGGSRLLFDQAAEFVSQLAGAHAVGLTVLPAKRPQYPFSTLRQPIVTALRKQLGTLGVKSIPSGADTQEAMAGLATVFDALRAVDGRRTIIFLCDLLPGSDQKLGRQMEEFLRLATDENIVIHVVATAPPEVKDVARRTASIPMSNEDGLLPLLSDFTGGLYLVRGSNGSIVLPQIERALSAHYILTFNVESADKDGKSHKIAVKVNRKNVDLRFRKEFVR